MDQLTELYNNALSAVQNWADGLFARLTNAQILLAMLALLAVIVVLIVVLAKKSRQYEDALDEIDQHDEAMQRVKQEAQAAALEGEKQLQEKLRAFEARAAELDRLKAFHGQKNAPVTGAGAEAERVMSEARDYALRTSQRADQDRAEIIANATREANAIREMANGIFQRANEAFKLAQERAQIAAFEVAHAPEDGAAHAAQCDVQVGPKAAPEATEGATSRADSSQREAELPPRAE